ncbi:CAAX amino terminal protease [Phytophthora cactorum]|nr:CAAX amino terminal protease [Phytophthora cactorum]
MRFSVTATTAVIACSCMAAAYVGVLYTLPHAIRRLPRDHPTHILARFLLICIFCAICPMNPACRLRSGSAFDGRAWSSSRGPAVCDGRAVHGLVTGQRIAVAQRVQAVPLERVVVRHKNSALYYSITHDRLPSLRTYVLGPLTEEFVFRSCMVPLLVCAEFTVKQIVLGSPLMFGAAHLHHFMEYVRHGRSPKDAALTVGHFASIFLVHIFCNVMGFPDLSFFNPENSLHPYRLVLLGAYFLGIYGFSILLMPLTEPAIYSSEMWNVTASATAHEFVFGYTETL